MHYIVKDIFGGFKHPAWTFKRQIRHTDIRNKVRNLKIVCENDDKTIAELLTFLESLDLKQKNKSLETKTFFDSLQPKALAYCSLRNSGYK